MEQADVKTGIRFKMAEVDPVHKVDPLNKNDPSYKLLKMFKDRGPGQDEEEFLDAPLNVD